MAMFSFVCPFCFEKVKVANVEYRCNNGWCPGRDEDDPKYAAYIGANAIKAGHVMQGAKTAFGAPKAHMCDMCGQPALKICPHCHNTIPDSTFAGTDNIISIIGTRSAGKSMYIGVLINELMRRVAPAFGASMSGFVDMSGHYNADRLYRATKYNPLYDNLETLGQTMINQRMMAGTDKDKIPLVYRFAYVNNKFGRKKDFTLAFFDAAGEDQEDPQLSATVMRYITHSKGVIFLLDPLQISEVLEQVETESGVKSTSTGTGGAAESVLPEVILANMTALIKRSLGIDNKRKKIDIPVAVAFSKFDAIQPIVPSNLTIQLPSPHCAQAALSASDVSTVDAEIRSILNSWNQQSIINAIETDYKNYSFFTFSSLGLGNAPDEEQKIKRPRPHRVEDPLLWLMAQNKLLMQAK